MHQEFRRVGRDLPGCDDPQVRDGRRLDDVFEFDGTHHVFAHTGFAAQAEFLVDMALAKVSVNDHDALASVGQHGAQVFGNEALAQAGAGAGDEQRVMGRIHQREVDRGTQATQALDGIVFGVADGEEFTATLGPLAALGTADDGRLFRTVRDGRVYRQAELGFDGFGVFDHNAQRANDPHHAEAGDEAEQSRYGEHSRRLHADSLPGGGSLVQDAHITHRAGLGHLELLGGIDQIGVEGGGDFHVASQL